MVAKRFDVYFVELDPTQGSEINKTRPCVIISPNEMNRVLNTIIVAPLTSTIRNYPMRVHCIVAKRKGQVALDQIRTIDKSRLKTRITALSKSVQQEIIDTLFEMFK